MIEISDQGTSQKIVGFDAFEGYPHFGRDYESRAAKELEDSSGFQPVDMQELNRMATMQGLQERIELVKGDVTSTFEGYTKANPGFRIALLNLDFDTYAATKAALETLYRRVVPNGVVVLDEYGASSWGESDAVDEFISAHDIKLQSTSWTHSPAAYFIKGHHLPQ